MPRSLTQLAHAVNRRLHERDKIQHMQWSFWLMLAATVLWTAPQAFLAVFAIGLAKECWDQRYGSGFCLFDMASNMIGLVGGLLFSLGLCAWLA